MSKNYAKIANRVATSQLSKPEIFIDPLRDDGLDVYDVSINNLVGECVCIWDGDKPLDDKLIKANANLSFLFCIEPELLRPLYERLGSLLAERDGLLTLAEVCRK